MLSPRPTSIMGVTIDGFKVDGFSWLINGKSPCDDLRTPVFVPQFLPHIEEYLGVFEWCLGALLNRHLFGFGVCFARNILGAVFGALMPLPGETSMRAV